MSIILGVLIIGVISPLSSVAQCPTGDIELKGQSGLYKFLQDYPDCVHLQGSLKICQSFINERMNLSPLSQLKSIGGTLRFCSHSQSTEDPWDGFKALLNLETVGSWNQAETNLHWISSDLTFEVQNSLIFRNNQQLTSLGNIKLSDSLDVFDLSYNWKLPKEELNKLSTVKYINTFNLSSWDIKEVPGTLDIEIGKNFGLRFMADLVNVDGLRFGDSLQSLFIIYNSSLNDPFDEFNTLEHIEYVNIQGTDSLTTIPEFASLKSVHDLSLADYSELNDLRFFENIDIMGTNISISNTNIMSLNGLLLDKEKDYNLTIAANEELIDISALEGFTSFENFRLSSSPNL